VTAIAPGQRTGAAGRMWNIGLYDLVFALTAYAVFDFLVED
jgi:hypothetical protein